MCGMRGGAGEGRVVGWAGVGAQVCCLLLLSPCGESGHVHACMRAHLGAHVCALTVGPGPGWVRCLSSWWCEGPGPMLGMG